MKAGIHPAYNPVKVICACGSQFETRSSHKGDIRLEICSSCHPFFTGKLKYIDTAGRIEKFQSKFASGTYSSVQAPKKRKPAKPSAES